MKTLVFDFYGVVCKNPYNSWFANHSDNTAIDRDFFNELALGADLGKMSESDYIDQISAKAKLPAEDVRNEVRSYDIIDHGVVNFIKSLKENYTVLLLSNAATGMVEKILDDNNIQELFDKLIISANVGMAKPSRAIFEYVLKDNDLNPEDTIFIDDSLENVEAAQKLGIVSILFTNLGDLKEKLAANGAG